MQEHFEETEKGLCLDVTVDSPLGLHARPAARLAQELLHFSAAVAVQCEGNTADAKSIVDLLALGAGGGSRLFFYAQGEDAHLCLSRISELFDQEFMA